MADASLIAIRMRLTGGSQVAAEAKEANAAIAETGAAAKTAGAQSASASARIAKSATSLKTAGRGLSKYVTLPLLGVAAVSGKMALDFDRNMRNVNSIAQLPEKRFDALKQKVLDLAGPTAQAPNTLAEGLYDLVSSGFDASESVSILKKSALAASAGLTTTEVSTKAVAAALNAYHLKASAAGGVSDTLFETVNRGVLTFDQLSTSIGDALPFAAQLGVSLNQVGAAISTMTKQGLSAPESVTRLKNVMVTMIKPGKALEAALKSMNTTGTDLVKEKGLQGALEAIIGTTDGSKESLAALFPNIRALGGVLALTGKSAKTANEDLAAFQNTTGATAKVLQQQEKSFGFQMQRAWSSLQAVLIEIGTEVLPIVIPPFLQLVGAVKDGITWFSGLPGPIKRVGGELLVLAAVAGPMLYFAGSLAKAALAIQALGLASSASGGAGLLGKLSKGRLAAGAAGIAAGIGGQAVGGKGGELISNIGGGAGLGFAVGGPLGAAVGGTAGAVMTALPQWEALLGLTKKLTPAQQRLAASSTELTYWLGRQRDAGAGLAAASHREVAAAHRVHAATAALKTSRQHLAAVIQEYGRHSRPALHAEAQLTLKVDAHRRAINKLKRAEQLHGTALQAYKTEVTGVILAERHRINILEGLRDKQARLYEAARKSNPQSEKTKTLAHALLTTEGKLSEAHQHQGQTLSQIAEKGGPKLARFFERSNQEVLRAGGHWKALALQAEGYERAIQRIAEAPPIPQPPGFNTPPVFPHHKAPGHAVGGIATGLSLVGEQGPELAYFKRPAQIIPAGRTRDLLAGRNEAPRAAQAARQFRGAGGGSRLLAPITIKIGRREIAEVIAETTEDAEARL